jgi:hypothetical protein
MATKVFHIELRVPGVSDVRIHKAIMEAVRIHARNLYGATVLVVGDGTKPAIAAFSEDYIIGQDKILIEMTPEEQEMEDNG